MIDRSSPEKACPIAILHKDERLIVVSKPAGMIVHRGWGLDAVTVADIVRDQLVGQPVHAVHRLDRGTSGVLLFALDAAAARHLQSEFQSSGTEKLYLALVRGPMLNSCTLDHPVPRVKDGERVPAITNFIPIAHKDRWSLVEARPKTGRLHQIRRHLKHLSHPVVGDVKYGKGPINRLFREEYSLHRMALHAWKISLTHPDGHRLDIQAELPQDLLLPLQSLGIWPLVDR